MPINFPNSPSTGSTYDYEGIHYIYNGTGWVNKSIYGISGGTGINLTNYNGTGPLIISVLGSVGPTGATGVTGADGATGSQGIQGNTGATGADGATGAGGALGYWGSFWSTQDQQAAGTTVAYPITYNNTDPNSNGVSIVSNSRITFSYPGVYNIEFSAQADRVSGSGTDTIDIWFRKNGTDIADSNTIVTVSGGAAAAKTVAAWNYMLQVNANDYVELMWRTSDTRLEFIADPAGTNPTRPAIPSVILSAHQVMYTQLGPTGPTGPMPTDYVSSFNGKTGAVQGVSSINGNTGAISNVAFTNTAQSFTGLQQFTQGISGSGGITFNSDVNINDNNSLVVATIINPGGKSQLDIDNRASSRVAIGDYDGGGNSTYIFLRDNTSGLQISNPYGAIEIGDPNGIDAGNIISYSSPDATLYGNNSNIDGFANIFASYVSASQGISASGATFANNISVNTAKLGKTGSNLIFGDSSSGNSISTGINNTIIGEGSGGSLTSGNQNACVGYQTLNSLTTGSSNTAVGFWALRNGTTGSNNTAIGTRALRSNTTGSDNIGIGIYALELNQTGNANIAIGGFALSEGATSAANNIAIGYAALLKNTTGSQNVAIGRDAVRSNTTASDNVGIGYQSLFSATSGGNNTGVGTNTGYRLTTGTNNTAIGYQALFGSASVTSTSNTAVGYNSMVSNTSGSYNSGIGLGSLYSLTSGQQNTAVGAESLYSITNTSNNTAVGQLAFRYATQGSNNTAIGTLAGAYKTASNTNLTAIGNDNVYIGSEARASGDSINNEIVIGSKALGLGANTAVIGATGQVSATIYGLFNAPGGVSAAGITTDALHVRAAGSARFLEFIPGINNQIIARGNSTLNLIQESHQSIYIGDFDAQNNATYVEVDDANQIIKFYFNGDYYTFPIVSGTVGQVLGIDSANTLGWRSSVSSLNGLTGAVQYIVDFKRGWFLS